SQTRRIAALFLHGHHSTRRHSTKLFKASVLRASPTAILKPLHARRTRPAPPAPAGALASARQRALHVSTLRSSSSTPQDRREGQGLDLITTLSSSTQELLQLHERNLSLYAARFAAKDEGHGGTRGKGFRVVRHWLRGQGTICRDMLGMSPNTFDALKRNLTEDGGLKGGKDISAREKLAIFLYVSRVAASTRQAAGVFGHTPTTIGLAFKAVLRALMKAKVYRRHVYLPPPSAPVPARITDDPGLNPFFKKVQADLFPALAVVHNLIRRLDPAADIEPDLVNDDASGAGEDPEPHAPPADAEAAAAARDRISKKMWKKYKP
ncbi:unnamed protein product, partial [Tilletia controversa]